MPFSVPKLALYYLIVGLFVNLLKGVLTEAITRLIARRENIQL
ncbi:MAG TPA: PTS glucitol/sorbitol transporter subunit IIC [Paraburkholderia sp.]|nr:PTS glucitol/sorbitol transporter subunit IIC [Paraburkholderia sp.]